VKSMYVLGGGMTLNIASVTRVDESCNEGDVRRWRESEIEGSSCRKVYN
jgi:hypothetical protein